MSDEMTAERQARLAELRQNPVAQWYDYHCNLVELATHLNNEGEFDNPAGMLYFFEKPWKYTTEWETYKAGKGNLCSA